MTGDELHYEPVPGWGLLPHGMTGVVMQDRKGEWHQAAVGRGAWLCVLPQRAGVTRPSLPIWQKRSTR